MDKGWQHTSGTLELFLLAKHMFPRRPKACICDWARTPTGIQWVLGKIWHTCFLMCSVQLFLMLKSKLGAGTFSLPLFEQSGLFAICLFYPLHIPSQLVSFLLHFTIEWVHHYEHIWAVIQLSITPISTNCRLVSKNQAFWISSWPVWACMGESAFWKGYNVWLTGK